MSKEHSVSCNINNILLNSRNRLFVINLINIVNKNELSFEDSTYGEFMDAVYLLYIPVLLL